MTNPEPENQPKRAVLAGASGFVGRHLLVDFRRRGYELAIIGRNGPDATWNDHREIRRLVDGADVVVNLAGKSVGCRYTDKNRNEILKSRIDTTRVLREAIASAKKPPQVWMNSSTGTIYRYADDKPQTETDGEYGSGFSVDVARNWEDEFFKGDLPRVRRVALRMAIVLGDEGALELLVRAARLGLGGPNLDGWAPRHHRYQGIGPNPTDGHTPGRRSKGEQKFSWLHIDDLIQMVAYIEANESISGPVNCAAPEPATNTELMAALRQEVGRPFYLPAYRWMLEIGMFALRQESELILKSRWVNPKVLLDAGFQHRWTDLKHALADQV